MENFKCLGTLQHIFYHAYTNMRVLIRTTQERGFFISQHFNFIIIY